MSSLQINSTVRGLERITEMLDVRSTTPEFAAFVVAVVMLLLLTTSRALLSLRGAFVRIPRASSLLRMRESRVEAPGTPTLRAFVALLGGFVVLTPPTHTSAQAASAISDEEVPSMHLVESTDDAEPTPPSTTAPQSPPIPTTLPLSEGESQVRPPTHSNLLPEFGIAAPVPLVADDYWTVETADCLWIIAAAVRTQQLSRPASNSETLDYMHRIIDANRNVLVDPDRPDLIYPGQAIRLPKA